MVEQLAQAQRGDVTPVGPYIKDFLRYMTNRVGDWPGFDRVPYIWEVMFSMGYTGVNFLRTSTFAPQREWTRDLSEK